MPRWKTSQAELKGCGGGGGTELENGCWKREITRTTRVSPSRRWNRAFPPLLLSPPLRSRRDVDACERTQARKVLYPPIPAARETHTRARAFPLIPSPHDRGTRALSSPAEQNPPPPFPPVAHPLFAPRRRRGSWKIGRARARCTGLCRAFPWSLREAICGVRLAISREELFSGFFFGGVAVFVGGTLEWRTSEWRGFL